ncbi:MAG: GH25 family lysozyme [Ruminococcus sp.]
MKFKKLTAILFTAVTLLCVAAFSVSALDYTVFNATEIQKHIAGLITLSDEKQKEYDFNGDGILTISDTTYLQKMLSDSIEETTTEIVCITEQPATEYATTEPITEPTTIVYPSKLELNKSSLTLGIGEKYTLVKNTDISDYPFNFKSNNSSVATVNSTGTITAVSCGTTTITCSSENGLTASCKVTVGNMAQGVTLNKTSLTLGVGEKFDLNSYIPDGTIAYFRLYYSNNSEVAPIEKSSGLVTAKKQGTATITCKLYNGVTATCTITVKAAPSSVSLSVSSKTLKVGEDYIISENTNSGSYSYNFTWSSSNTKVATIKKTSGNKAQISPKMQGTTTITIKTYNGKTATCKITISGSKVKCIDVSTWQGSNIDFNKVKSDGINYVILRAGYGRETYQKDDTFETNYAKAKSAGLEVGVYWFSYAMSASEATKEANACLYCLGNKELDLPVYYDLEYAPAITSLNKSTYTQMAVNFCDKIENAGYDAGVYASASVYSYPLNYNTVSSKYSIWNAEWNSYYTVNCDIWQFTDCAQVSGISGNVDMSYIYNLNIVN